MLDSKKFEASNDEGEKFGGKVDREISEEELVSYEQNFINEFCTLSLGVQTITFGTGKVQKYYTLYKIVSEA